jgi:uncharacterized protein (TIGR03083 family)
MIAYEGYAAAIARESDALTDAARTAGIDAPITSCPDWQVADLLAHIGWIQHWVGEIIHARPADPPDHWRQRQPPDRETRIEWFAEGADTLVAELRDARPDEEAWSWFPDHSVGFWARRMAHEVAVHRWDAETAVGHPQPIDPELAVDGIQEAFDLVPVRLAGHPPAGNGETIHLHCTDGEGEWLLRLEPDGLVVTNEHAKGDVAARGSASDLLLLVCGRVPPEQVEVFGDAALLTRWQELTKF